MWTQVHTLSVPYANVPIPVGYVFTTTPIILSAISTQFPNSSYRVGFLKVLTDISPIGQVDNFGKTIYLGNKYLEVPLINGANYTAEFYPYHYVRNLTLRFWEFQP